MRKLTKRSVAVLAAGAIAVGGGGAAYAAWLMSGSGKVTASAGKAEGLTVTGASVTPLVPGGTSDVTLTVTNPNSFPVTVTGITLSDFSTKAAGSLTAAGSGCDAAKNVKFVRSALPAGGGALNIDAKTGDKAGSKEITYVGAIKMEADADDECQGANFTFNSKVEAKSNAA